MKVLQEKLNFLLEKYSVDVKAELKDEKTVVINGVEVPLLAHRNERRFLEQKNIVTGGTLQGVSVMRVARIIEKGSDIYEALYRELDICRYVLGRKLISIMVMQNDNVLNAISTCEDGVVCTLEISATLAKGEVPKDKHEIIAQRGTCCDVVVDAQLKQDSIYIFGEENQKFTDVDFELFGLTIEQVAIVRAAFGIAQKNNIEEMKTLAGELDQLIAMAKRSAENGEREVL
ncbi:MAG: hypothetical protein IKU07_09675 [Oscillospiraceae bacterium]|nr:hypothetical protein [Oscillospiraceae bacterium]